MEKINWKIVKPEGSGLIHASRQDAANTREAINRLILKINELIEKNNELERRISNISTSNSLPD